MLKASEIHFSQGHEYCCITYWKGKRKEVTVIEINNRLEKCTVCRQEYTSTHTEAAPGVTIYVCKACLEAAKYNFMWICMNCGKVYLRPKKLVINRLKDEEIKRAYIICEDMQIIQGIDICMTCDPEGIFNYMESQKIAVEC